MSVDPSRGRTNATCRVLSLPRLLRVSKDSLKHWPSVLLAAAIGLFEAKRPIRAVEALIDAVRARAPTPLV